MEIVLIITAKLKFKGLVIKGLIENSVSSNKNQESLSETMTKETTFVGVI